MPGRPGYSWRGVPSWRVDGGPWQVRVGAMKNIKPGPRGGGAGGAGSEEKSSSQCLGGAYHKPTQGGETEALPEVT